MKTFYPQVFVALKIESYGRNAKLIADSHQAGYPSHFDILVAEASYFNLGSWNAELTDYLWRCQPK
jgi:hypothetical protein